jgi:hypothetical protein
MPVDAGCDWLDRRQIDVIIGVDVAHIGRAERVVAMRAGNGQSLDDLVGMFSEPARHAPGRLGRGFLLPRSGRFGFWPFDGGRLELPGVFGDTASLASSSPMRALSAAICKACA